jgi:uncharacterized protein (TIGR00661 family)
MVKKINEAQWAGKKVLVAPLDWGLGHTTRCIPIVKALLAADCSIWLCGSGAQEILLKSEFPYLPFLPLSGYDVNYARSAMMVKILMQLPKILKSIRREHQWLNEKMIEHTFDAVISDNRYGLYHKKAHCVFVTHQLRIRSPLGQWSEKMLQRWNYQFINRFNECWVPDEKGKENLAGDLSHPRQLPEVPVIYIGAQSRFHKKNNEEVKDHLLIILSGPEPQRSILENKIINEIAHYPGTAVIVRGTPAVRDIIPSTDSIRFYNHLTTDQLNNEIEKAAWVISRCGYSTVMDMAAMKKKSILIPTPGQTEQEYLASHLNKKQFALCVSQKEFSLQKVLNKAMQFEYRL